MVNLIEYLVVVNNRLIPLKGALAEQGIVDLAPPIAY